MVPIGMKKSGGGQPEPKTKTLAADMSVRGKQGASAAPLLLGSESKGTEQGAGLDGLVPNLPKSRPTTGCSPASDPPPPRRPPSERRLRWAELLKRVFELDALRCPACDGKMRVLAAITQPGVARRILKCLSLLPRAPPIAPARPFAEESPRKLHGIDVLGENSLEGRESLFDFDQTPTEEWDLRLQSDEDSPDLDLESGSI